MSFSNKVETVTLLGRQIRHIAEPSLVTEETLESALESMFPGAYRRIENYDDRSPPVIEFTGGILPADDRLWSPGFDLDETFDAHLPLTPNDVLFKVLVFCIEHMCYWMEDAASSLEGEVIPPHTETREYVFRGNVVNSGDILRGERSPLTALKVMTDTTREELIAAEEMFRRTFDDYALVWAKYEEILHGRWEDSTKNVKRFMCALTPLMIYISMIFESGHNFDHREYSAARPPFVEDMFRATSSPV